MTKTEDRDEARRAFLEKAGWAEAEAAPLAGDASTRSYQRLMLDGRPAVLMIAPPGAEAPACPPDADEAARRALGYNAMARLAGPNLNAFTALSEALRAAGLSAPDVYAADASAGLALIEDLGDDLFARVVGRVEEERLYRAAIDALAALHRQAPSKPSGAGYRMLDYDALAMEAEAALLIDWYWPLKKGAPAEESLTAEYFDIWRATLAGLSAPHAFVLRDYHAENLLWLPDRSGVEQVGIIDFQDALFGHAAYDVVSLLEDARRDVDLELAEAMIVCYLSISNADREAFMRDYAILAAQRNAKILGIFARLAKRDKKPRYLDLLPRVEAHFARDLARPELAPLRAFFAKHLPDLVS
ncbi:aminoglycoside phosphotransferase family protein [Hyphococcus luteus]|uniref:Aminoglycoside phosphotransferase n=1 Tax=Hyphococcus luteus TaxID=2058213 RepID=A0A2S7K8M3_9PROT|nr:phosphotransferase [Marinicaulis flavus]PQA88840.1 aminoglycoside phosphotransferase [Marinicaulis flavus]